MFQNIALLLFCYVVGLLGCGISSLFMWMIDGGICSDGGICCGVFCGGVV